MSPRAPNHQNFGSIYEILEQEEGRIVAEVLDARGSLGSEAQCAAASLPLIAAFRAWHESDPRPPLADFLTLARVFTLQGVPAALAIEQSPESPKQAIA